MAHSDTGGSVLSRSTGEHRVRLLAAEVRRAEWLELETQADVLGNTDSRENTRGS